MPKQQQQPENPERQGLPEEASGSPAADDGTLAEQGSAAEGTMQGSPDPVQAEAEETDESTEFGSSKSDMYRGVPGDRIGG